jgi:ketosteroid isomerase-like protein
MSQENVEVVREAWSAWLRRDMEALFSHADPEVVYDLTHFREWPDRLYRGVDGIQGFFDEWLALWESFEAGADEFLAAPDGRVVMLVWQRGTGRQSGLLMEMEWALIVTLRDGTITRWDAYADRSQALEAAGLSE